MPFGLGAPELILIFLLILMVFGVGKLPEAGRALGKGIREFRSSLSDEGAKETRDEPIAKHSS